MVGKQIYNQSSRRYGRVIPLYRNAHKANPYSRLFLDDEEDEIVEEKEYEDGSESEPEPSPTPKRSPTPKKHVAAGKPVSATKKNGNKRQRRAISNDDDDDDTYLDAQIQINKSAPHKANPKAASKKKGVKTTKITASAKKSTPAAKKPHASTKKPPAAAKKPDLEDDFDFDDMAKTKEGQRASSAKDNSSSSKNNEINELKARLAALDNQNQKLEHLLQDREHLLDQQVTENKTISTKLKVANQYIDKTNEYDDRQYSLEISDTTLSKIRQKVVKAFRDVKFINNDEGFYLFGDLIMDLMGDVNLTRNPQESDEDKLIAEDNRKIYRHTYQNFWRRCLNDHRSTVQVTYIADSSDNMFILWTSPPFLELLPHLKNELRKVVLEYMGEKNWTKLPHPDLLDKFLVRDFSQFDIEEDDDTEITEAKAKDLAEALDFFDFYYDKMVPTVAGKKVWHPHARHHECMSTSLLPNKQPRVPPNTESMVAVMYRNCHNKWNEMHAWDLTKQGPYPLFKKPNTNPEWATEYSDACGGQQRFGGWSIAGRVKFVKLAKIVLKSRKKNAGRHHKVELACIRRLQTKYESLYVNKSTRADKKRKALVATREEEELLQCFIVDEDDDEEEEVNGAEDDEYGDNDSD